MQKWFHRIGWALGITLSIILPRLTAPQNLVLSFTLGGGVSAILGFSSMLYLLKRKQVSKLVKWGTAAISAVVGLSAGQVYRILLIEYANPPTAIMWAEYVLFCVAYLGIFVLLAFAYRNGGLFILDKFGKL